MRKLEIKLTTKMFVLKDPKLLESESMTNLFHLKKK